MNIRQCILCGSFLALAACHQPMTQIDATIPGSDYEASGPDTVKTENQAKNQRYNRRPPVQRQTPQAQQQQPSDYVDFPEGKEVRADVATTEDILPSMSYVNERIAQYNKKQDRWRELDRQSAAMNLNQQETEAMVDCYRRLQKVLNGYNNLRSKMLEHQTSANAKSGQMDVARDLNKSDVDFLESNCGYMLSVSDFKGSSGLSQKKSADSLPELEAMINASADQGKFDAVAENWQRIPNEQKERVDMRTKLSYGLALMYQRKSKDAVEMFKKVVEQMTTSDKQPTDLISLRKTLADLYTANGDYAAAETQYQKIMDDYKKLGKTTDWATQQLSILQRSQRDSPELTAYADLMKNYLAYTPERDGYRVAWQADKFLQAYPHSAVAANVEMIKAKVQERAEKWLNSFVNSVDRLAAEKKYKEATDMLGKVSPDIVDPSRKDSLKMKNDEIVMAEAVDRETDKLAKSQELQRKWNNGLLLEKNERLDEALVIYSSMIDTEYADKAKAKVADLSLRAAQENRRKAADLFIRYTKTSDIESKKKLLLESRRLLREILTKYPSIDISAKVQSNIERVEQEMRTLDPGLINQADSSTPPGE